MSTDTDASNAQALAEACAHALWADDRASQGLGLKVERVGPGRASLSMTVTAVMANGHGTCHGGFIFMLADSAFAFACNSFNERHVAQHCSITFLAPAKVGDQLMAEATERVRAGRSGICDITVTRSDGTTIAEFRGNSRSIGGALVSER